MQTELSKKDKKVARELIAKGLDAEFKIGLTEFEAILQQWQTESGDNREYYHKLYAAVMQFNKHIAWRYDYMPGSKYLDVLTWQVRDQLIQPSELEALNPETRDEVLVVC